MGCITSKINALCVLSNFQFYLNFNSLFEKIISVANFFGFQLFLDEFKIKIQICSELDFNQKKNKFQMNDSEDLIAFTCNVNQIFVLEYEKIKNKYTFEEYEAVIIHECVHVFQAYFSRLSPKQYIWLYESVACHLAEQKKHYDLNKLVSWDTFINDFYNIDDCYGLAYKFGNIIFSHFGQDIFNVIKNPIKYIEQLKYIYATEIFSVT